MCAMQSALANPTTFVRVTYLIQTLLIFYTRNDQQHHYALLSWRSPGPQLCNYQIKSKQHAYWII